MIIDHFLTTRLVEVFAEPKIFFVPDGGTDWSPLASIENQVSV